MNGRVASMICPVIAPCEALPPRLCRACGVDGLSMTVVVDAQRAGFSAGRDRCADVASRLTLWRRACNTAGGRRLARLANALAVPFLVVGEGLYEVSHARPR
jgi:hypothetical protein